MTAIIELHKRRRPIFERSYETSRLAEVLAKASPGDVFTYATLGQVISKHVDGSTRALHSARRIVQREHGLVFDAVIGVGVKCLTSPEIVQAADKGRLQLGRRARSAREKLSQSNYHELDERSRTRYAIHQSIFGAVSLVTSQRAVTAIGKVVSSSAREMPIRETLALFQKLPKR